VRAISSPE
jgi:hypothetical protein